MNSETRNSLDSLFDIKPQLPSLVQLTPTNLYDSMVLMQAPPQRYLATAEKVLREYHLRRDKEKDQIKDYIYSRASDIKRCINDRRPMYIVGFTQSNKTEAIKQLSTLVIDENVADVLIIATTNMLDALDQLYRRVEPEFNNRGLSVYTTDNLPSRITTGDVIITLVNVDRAKLLASLVKKTTLIDTTNGREPLRYLCIHDEADEMEAASGDPNYNGKKAQAEEQLWDLLFESRGPISYVKVSATLMSAFYTSGRWVSTYKDVQAYQVLELPLSPDYIGLNSPKLTIVPNLVNEDKRIFNQNSLLSACQYPSDSKNISTIVDALVSLSNSCSFEMTQIGNVVYGNKMLSHVRMASLLADDVRDRYGWPSAVWNTNSLTSLPRNTQMLCIVQNGDVKPKTSLEERLQAAADYFDHLKIVAICADKMTNKSITIDSGYDSGLYDATSRRFGFYCNFTVLYAMNTAVEPCIQYLRCTGNRPPLKQHMAFTLPAVARDIRSYVDDQTQNLENLRKSGRWSKEQTLALRVERGLGKKEVNKRLLVSRPRHGTLISVETRNDLVSTHDYHEIDGLYSLTTQEFSTAQTRQGIIDLARAKEATRQRPFIRLYAPTDKEIRVNLPQSICNWKDEDTWRANIEMARNGNTPAQWTLTVFQSGQSYFLHFRNNMIWNYVTDKDTPSNDLDCVKYMFETSMGELHVVGAMKYCFNPDSKTAGMWKEYC